MGMFLALAGVIGKSQAEVEKSLSVYAQTTGGIFTHEAVDQNHEDWCVMGEANGNTTVYYPNSLMQWDKVSEHLSRDLNTAVFSCHIHDGDLWMYVLFVNGRTEDQFNPIPEYWEELDEAEMSRWRGNATTVAQHVPGLKPASIAKYLTRWNLDEPEVKAYADDQYGQEDWQLLDFLRKLGLSFPLDDDGNATGTVYRFHPAREDGTYHAAPVNRPVGKPLETSKPWWKFW